MAVVAIAIEITGEGVLLGADGHPAIFPCDGAIVIGIGVVAAHIGGGQIDVVVQRDPLTCKAVAAVHLSGKPGQALCRLDDRLVAVLDIVRASLGGLGHILPERSQPIGGTRPRGHVPIRCRGIRCRRRGIRRRRRPIRRRGIAGDRPVHSVAETELLLHDFVAMIPSSALSDRISDRISSQCRCG